MIAVVQRVLDAQVVVGGMRVGQIGPGLAVLAAVEARDTPEDLDWMAAKLVSLRVFRHENKHFELDIRQAGGAMLLVSNFTVAAQTAKGRRPSLSQAAPPERARMMFDHFVAAVRAQQVPVQTGEFGADMQVELTNDGPVTLIVESPRHD